jgi:hypothetical protein
MWELKQRIEKNEGVLTITMEVLRNAYGRERLGKNILEEIAALLRRLGIEHQPRQLSACQSDYVRLYIAKSAVGRIIKAAVSWSSSNDDTLRKAASSKTVEALQRVRELAEQLNEVVEDID